MGAAVMASRRRVLALPLAVLALAARATELGEARSYWPTERWRRARPERHGMNPVLLAEADRIIQTTLPHLTGLVIVRHGYIVFERYYSEIYDRTHPLKIRSVTKSVVGTLVGIALTEGHLTSLEQTLGELIPHRLPPNADPLTPTITLEHLLTMTSGWAWDIGNDYRRLIGSENWVELTLSLPVAYEPGTVYTYNTGGSHLLSVILTDVTGQDTADYAQEKLFGPLGIPRPTWLRSPQGETSGGFGLELTPREMAKLGYLYLNSGTWDGEQIVPGQYVQRATTYQSAGDATGYAAYGYQWWVTEAAGHPSYFALGFGGQYIYVVPALDLVIVTAAGFEASPAPFNPPRPVIEGAIVPAVVGP